ncbi:hypothetical protein PV326_002835 [Microctonus aethiopoides]|nr:hypothetical protein PV326_002835 [Microctonus aethiopoides]
MQADAAHSHFGYLRRGRNNAVPWKDVCPQRARKQPDSAHTLASSCIGRHTRVELEEEKGKGVGKGGERGCHCTREEFSGFARFDGASRCREGRRKRCGGR